MDILSLLPILASITAIVLGWLGFRRNQKNDDSLFTQQFTILSSDVNYIKKTIESHISSDDRKLEKYDDRLTMIVERLSKIEEEAKSNRSRIDILAKDALSR